MKTSCTCVIQFRPTNLDHLRILHRMGNHRNVAFVGVLSAEEAAAASAAAKAVIMRDRPTDYIVSVEVLPIASPYSR